MAAPFPDLFAATPPIKLNGKKVRALVDTGSTENFKWESLIQKLRLPILPGNNTVSMSPTSLSFQMSGKCGSRKAKIF